MKKLTFLAAVSALVFAGCAKDGNVVDNNREKLTRYTISAGLELSRTTIGDAGDGRAAKVSWAEGDVLAVIRKDAPQAGVYPFELEPASAGGASGVFTGQLAGEDVVYAIYPHSYSEHGDNEDIIIPVNLAKVPLPSLAIQHIEDAEGWAHLGKVMPMVCQMGGYERTEPFTNIEFQMEHLASVLDIPISVDRSGGYAYPVKIHSVEISARNLFTEADIDFTKNTSNGRLQPRPGSRSAIELIWPGESEPVLTAAGDKAVARIAVYPFMLTDNQLTIKVVTGTGTITTTRTLDKALVAGKRYHHAEVVLDMAKAIHSLPWDGVVPAPDVEYFKTDGTGTCPGTGYASDPWLISTPAQLVQFAANQNDIATLQAPGIGYYGNRYLKLTADIDLGGAFDPETKTGINLWPMIANTGLSGQGSVRYGAFIDGDGHTIKNMVIVQTNPTKPVGFIGQCCGGQVANLTFDSGCYVYVNTNSTFTVGGVFGDCSQSRNAELRKSSNIVFQGTVEVNSTTSTNAAKYVAAIAGRIASSNDASGAFYPYALDGCVNEGNVTLTCNANTLKYAGGIVGLVDYTNNTSCIVMNCVNKGRINVTDNEGSKATFVGGIAAATNGAIIGNCLSTGAVYGLRTAGSSFINCGGVVGDCASTYGTTKVPGEMFNCVGLGEYFNAGALIADQTVLRVGAVVNTTSSTSGVFRDLYGNTRNGFGVIRSATAGITQSNVTDNKMSEEQMQGSAFEARTLSATAGGGTYTTVLEGLNQAVAAYNASTPAVAARHWVQGPICPLIK